jgi:hypothetical protein
VPRSLEVEPEARAPPRTTEFAEGKHNGIVRPGTV